MSSDSDIRGSKRATRFRPSDLTRVLKATIRGGVTVARIEISPNGKIAIIAGRPPTAERPLSKPYLATKDPNSEVITADMLTPEIHHRAAQARFDAIMQKYTAEGREKERSQFVADKGDRYAAWAKAVRVSPFYKSELSIITAIEARDGAWLRWHEIKGAHLVAMQRLIARGFVEFRKAKGNEMGGTAPGFKLSAKGKKVRGRP